MEIKDLIIKQNEAFEEFKRSNDDRLRSLETKSHVDPLLDKKVDTINDEISNITKQLEDIAKKANRPGFTDSQEKDEYTKAFEGFVRKGMDIDTKTANSVNITTDENGGYAVPDELDRKIVELVSNVSPIRRLATVINVSTPNFKKIVNLGGAGGGFVGETAARPQTNAPTFATVEPKFGELYANIYASSQSLDDIFFDVGQLITSETSKTFGKLEGEAFLTGDGNDKPKGILTFTQATSGDIDYGVIGGVETSSASVITGDELLDVVYSLKSGYRQKASWLLNNTTIAAIRKMKDKNDNYLWAPGLSVGQPQTLLNYPVYEDDNMSGIISGETVAIFGDFSCYLICDRVGTRIIRDNVTQKPYTLFYITKRIAGTVQDTFGFKVLNMA